MQENEYLVPEKLINNKKVSPEPIFNDDSDNDDEQIKPVKTELG